MATIARGTASNVAFTLLLGSKLSVFIGSASALVTSSLMARSQAAWSRRTFRLTICSVPRVHYLSSRHLDFVDIVLLSHDDRPALQGRFLCRDRDPGGHMRRWQAAPVSSVREDESSRSWQSVAATSPAEAGRMSFSR